MTLIGFYGTLATTASIFVGILTAYLVTRLSDLKAGRSRIRRQVDDINIELKSLKTGREERVQTLAETQNRWTRETAEDQVDRFITLNVGREWNPSPDAVNVADALDALIRYRDLEEEAVIQHHYDELENRWSEIIEKLRPQRFSDPENLIDTAEIDAANMVLDGLWNIYDQERYERRDNEVSDATQRIKELESKREDLKSEYNSLDPQDLQDSVKATAVPIVASVILPLLVRFFHEMSISVSELADVAFLEPWAVLIIWLFGFIWTLWFIWNRVQDMDEKFPDGPTAENESSDCNEPEVEPEG